MSGQRGRRERGMTMIGLLVIGSMVGLIGYGAVRLLPVYMTQFKIQKILNDVESEFEGNGPTQSQLGNAIAKRLDVEMIYFPERKDFTIKQVEDGFRVGVNYEDRVPFIGNLFLGAEFDNHVDIRR
jgi:hypothetical protein